MSKIVCDVCGSSYSETETQCPICGTAKSESVKPVVETTMEESAAKGGKFSKENNRKNTSSRQGSAERSSKSAEPAPSNMAMIIIVGVLLLAIVAVCVFIAVRFMDKPETPDNTSSSSSTASSAIDIPATGIELVGNDSKSLSFTALTDVAQLTVQPVPSNTTDVLTYTYTSSDPAVVQVSQDGKVTPVADGNATITISDGKHEIVVNVTCDIFIKLELTAKDITLSPDMSLTYTLYNGKIDPAKITWKSSDEKVATVKDGVVTALSNGNITVTATYEEQEVSCNVHVKNMDKQTTYQLTTTWGDKSEATLKVGEKTEIWLTNKATGEIVKGLKWTLSNDFPKCCTQETGEKGIIVTGTAITANVSGQYVYVRTEYEGETYTFKIRVRAAETQE